MLVAASEYARLTLAEARSSPMASPRSRSAYHAGRSSRSGRFGPRVGCIVTRKQLLLVLWVRHSTSETQHLRVYRTHLRRKLEPAGRSILRMEAGIGYGLECP